MQGATLAVSYRAGWLLGAAVPALFPGLAFYVFIAPRSARARRVSARLPS
jgi:hypothetical protein